MTIKIAPVANTQQQTGRIRLGGESPSLGPVRS